MARNNGSVILEATSEAIFLLFPDDVAAAGTIASELAQLLSSEGISARIGLHFGAFDLAAGRSPSGDATKLATNLARATPPGEIFVTAQMAALLQQLPEFEEALEPVLSHALRHEGITGAFRLRTPSQAAKYDYSSRDLARAQRILSRARKGKHEKLASAEAVAKRLKGLRRDFVFGLCIVFIGALAHIWLERSELGQKLQLWAYEKLQPMAPGPSGALPIVIVDFRNNFDVGPYAATDMDKLAALLKNIEIAQPKAIGIDIDFGVLADGATYPDANGRVVDFALQSRVPVILAVGRGLWTADPSDWLGADTGPNGQKRDVSEIVAHAYAPVTTGGTITLFDPIRLGSRQVPSLASRLADLYSSNRTRALDHPNWWISPYAEETTAPEQTDGRGRILSGKQYFLNTSALDQFDREKIVVRSPDDIRPGGEEEARLHNAIVLVGSDDRFLDAAIIGSQHRSGIFLHALGVYTKLFAPVYEVQPLARLLLAVVVTLLMFGASLGIRRMYIARSGNLNIGRLTFLTSLSVAGLILLAGSLLVRYYGILWTDYFLVLLLLLVHPNTEHHIESALGAARQGLARAWRGILWERAGNED